MYLEKPKRLTIWNGLTEGVENSGCESAQAKWDKSQDSCMPPEAQTLTKLLGGFRRYFLNLASLIVTTIFISPMQSPQKATPPMVSGK